MARLLQICLAVFLTSVLLVACVKNKSFENGMYPNPNGSNFTGCKSCKYLPWCDGSVYNYIDSSAGGINTQTTTLSIVSDTIIGTTTYSKTLFDGQTYYHHCSNDISTIVGINRPGFGGSTVAQTKNVVLRANANVGATWSDVNDGGNGVVNTTNYEIISMGTTRTVVGVLYPDVIQVTQSTSASIPGVGTSIVSTGDYYYAKGVGLIESLTRNSNGLTIQHRVLETYSIP